MRDGTNFRDSPRQRPTRHPQLRPSPVSPTSGTPDSGRWWEFLSSPHINITSISPSPQSEVTCAASSGNPSFANCASALF